MTRLGTLLLATLILGLAVAPASADEGESSDGQAAQAPVDMGPTPMAKALGIVGACLGAGLAAVGGGLGIARIGGQCIDAIARQPEASGAMFAPMIVTAAMVEGGMLFAMVVCLLGVLFI